MKITKPAVAGVLLGSVVLSAPAAAHHSFAMFDNSRITSLEGTVKDFQWTNPHVWIDLTVGSGGKGTTWSIEGQSVTQMKGRGWTKTSVKPGDKVVVTLHPLKDGTPGGSLMTISVNGKTIGG